MAATTSSSAGSSRRHGMRPANPYQSSYAHHRAVASSSGGGRHLRDNDEAGNPQESSRPKSSPQRKRVVVACRRCRKRKIRCSGDDGQGGPCTNCQSSGEPHCLFLRVASQETPMRSANGFTYTLDACRRYQARGSTMVQPMSLPSGNPPSGAMAPQMEGPVNLYTDAAHLTAANTFRGDQAYVYSGSGRDFGLQGWNQGAAAYAADGNMGYNMYPSPFPSLAVQDPSYMYQQGDHTSTPMADRSATALAEAAGTFSLQNMAQGLPNANDRLLPMPIHRQLPSTILPSSRGSASSSLYSRTSYPSTASGSPAGTGLTEMSPNYGYEDSASATQYAAVPLLASHAVQRIPDMYTTSQPEAMLPMTGDALQPQASPDLTYRYQDTTRRPDSAESSPVSSLSGPQQLDGSTQQL